MDCRTWRRACRWKLQVFTVLLTCLSSESVLSKVTPRMCRLSVISTLLPVTVIVVAELYSVVVFFRYQVGPMQRKIYLCLRVIQCCKKLLLLTQACRLSIASAVILVKIWISSAYISVATVLRWSEQNYSHLRQVFSWCCVPKIINIGQCFTELFKKITLAQFFETRRISLFALRKAITTA